MSYQKREYKLINQDTNQELILNGVGANNEPKNWDNADFTIKKSTKNFSTKTELSKNLEFTGNGAKFLIDAYNNRGVEARVKMYEYRFNPNTDARYIFTIGDFDFTKYSVEKNLVKVPFQTAGLNTLLSSKNTDKFELNRTTDINGNEIEPLDTNTFAVINRPLDLKSLMKSDPEDNYFRSEMQFNTRFRYNMHPLSVNVVYESDDSVLTVVPEQLTRANFFIDVSDNLIKQESPIDNIRSHTFYYNSDTDKRLSLKINMKLLAEITRDEDLSDKHLSIRLVRFSGGEDPVYNFRDLTPSEVSTGFKFPELDGFQTIEQMNDIFNTGTYNLDKEFNITANIKKGDSLALYVFGGGNFYESSGNAYFNLNLNNIETSIFIQEYSVRNDLPRRAKFAFNKDVGRSLMGIINGDKDTYKSEFFESGEFKLTGVTTGKLIRGFEDDTITTSFKEFIDNCNYLYNMSYDIEIIDGKETLVHEPLQYFFRPEHVIELTEQVNDVKRSVASEFIYSTIKSGYKKPSGDNLYEEVNGLNEFNTSNEYTTPITRLVNEYDIESPYRADSEGKELTLRKSIKLFPTEDYRTDKTIFNLDLKSVGTNIYEERTWKDDFEEAPKNVFNPDTATGLRFTPFRNLKRHFWFLNSAFTKFTEEYIRYSNTRGNSDLITKKAGEPEYKENGNYQISSLENAIFVSEWIEFTYKVDFKLMDAIRGHQVVNGRKIPNTYYKIKFINEYNETEYGYLFELKPNKEGKWKVLKAI